MGRMTTIAWCDATWNPWHGCRRVSAGCEHCYRFRDKARYGQDATQVQRSKTRFRAPRRWPEPRRIFTCSWSDFFLHEADAWRPEAWEVIRQTPQHTYLILTKRPRRMRHCLPPDWGTGYPNVWLGVSIEDAHAQARRLPVLQQVPAAQRFLSLEPLLEPLAPLDLTGIAWVMVGEESGHAYRPMAHAWVWPILEACQQHAVAFFFKQSAASKPGTGTALQHADGTSWYHHEWPDARRTPALGALGKHERPGLLGPTRSPDGQWKGLTMREAITIPHAPLAYEVVRLGCPACGARYLADGLLVCPRCPACAGGRLRPLGVWHIEREGWLSPVPGAATTGVPVHQSETPA